VKTIKRYTREEEKQQQNTSKSKHSEKSVEYSDEGYGLTEEEEEVFGDRFPYGFEKVKLLGRGGFSLVWLGKHIKSSKQFAIKQIITQNTHQTHIK
jgi:serine/threonine protein kinase